jgi:choice-of-anchor C domain-containing protein
MMHDRRWRKGFTTIFGLFFIILTLPFSVQASLIANGSFETGVNVPPINSHDSVSASSTTQINNWNVISGAIDWVGRNFWQASDGNYSVDLSFTGPGTISTSFSTIAGMDYILIFDLAGNPDGGPAVKTVEVDVASVIQTFTFDTTGLTRSNMGWQTQTLGFTANAATTTLAFKGVTTTGYGAAIDNVDVSAVPIPSAIVLLSTGLVALVGLRGGFKK